MTQVSRKGFVDKNGKKVVIIPKVPGATAGNLASLDENGNLQDSGKKPDDFAETDHEHDYISGYREGIGASVFTGEGDQGEGIIRLRIAGDGGGLKPTPAQVVEIGYYAAENLKRALQDPDTEPTEDSNKLVTSGGVKAAIDEVNEKIDRMHSLEYEDGSYESRMSVGKLNRDDDELDGAVIYGKDAIRVATAGGTVYIDNDNIENLRCALLGLEITFVRDENGDYAIDSNLKEYLNDLLEEMPADKCVPCVVHAQWWNGSSYDGGHFPGALCRHSFTTTGIPRTIYLSFLGNLFYATRTANNDFPNVWTKFENPFATVSADDDSGINGDNSAEDDQPSNDGLDG